MSESDLTTTVKALDGTDLLFDRDDETYEIPLSCDGLSPKELGRAGERAAANFLVDLGIDIIEMNWACYAGEADIIAVDGNALCFVEVKTRSTVDKGFPSEAVDAKKRSRYERIAESYLRTCDFCNMRVRFDVASIIALGGGRAFLRYHTNAFGVG